MKKNKGIKLKVTKTMSFEITQDIIIHPENIGFYEVKHLKDYRGRKLYTLSLAIGNVCYILDEKKSIDEEGKPTLEYLIAYDSNIRKWEPKRLVDNCFERV